MTMEGPGTIIGTQTDFGGMTRVEKKGRDELKNELSSEFKGEVVLRVSSFFSS